MRRQLKLPQEVADGLQRLVYPEQITARVETALTRALYGSPEDRMAMMNQAQPYMEAMLIEISVQVDNVVLHLFESFCQSHDLHVDVLLVGALLMDDESAAPVGAAPAAEPARPVPPPQPDASPAQPSPSGKEPLTLDVLRSRIESYLRVKGFSYEVKPKDELWVRQGSTVLTIRAHEWNDVTVVRLFAPVALECTSVTPEVMRYLAEKCNDLIFGKFSLDEENRIIWYEHALLGDFLDPEELYTALGAVACTADDHDEEISRMAGGKRVIDL